MSQPRTRACRVRAGAVPTSPATPAVFAEDRQPLSTRIQRFLHAYPTVVPFFVLLLGVVLGASVNWTRFTTGSNLSTILLQVTIIGILGIAQTLIILTAGIDLSVGIVMVLASIVMGRLSVILGYGRSRSASWPAPGRNLVRLRERPCWSRDCACRPSS